MRLAGYIAIFFSLLLQTAEPPYVREGDRVEAQYREYSAKLEAFFTRLKRQIEQSAPELLPTLVPPRKPVLYGYGLIPDIHPDPPEADDERFESRVYNWDLTGGYVEGEEIKLQRALQRMAAANGKVVLEELALEYRTLLNNQSLVDRHIQYNRFWQREIAADRPRFDRLTEIYNKIREDDIEVQEMVREVLGTPTVPDFVRIVRDGNRIAIHLPVYTDIPDTAFLDRMTTAVEEVWNIRTDDATFSLKLEIRQVTLEDPPERGTHVDLRAHTSTFPMDGAVLTTGAQSTHAFVGRAIILGYEPLSYRTVAHEFGHLLGFHDGYVRGYRDLGDRGFEIMEVVSSFEDIMSAPRAGRVLPEHYRMLLAAAPQPID